MHAHYGTFAEFPMWGGQAEDLIEEMDRLGVARMCVSHQACMAADIAWGNDQALDAMKRCPGRLLGYATCYPVAPEIGVDEIRRCVDAGMIGIKLHDYHTAVKYWDPRYAPVWEFADERALPVLLHTWGDLEKMEPLFARYTNAKIMLAHSGVAHPDRYVAVARKYPNVWLELCQSIATYGLVEYFVREVGAERLLFGSDAPWMAIPHQLGRVLFADLTVEQKKQILIENPKTVLGS